jgi:hypothetical protein
MSDKTIAQKLFLKAGQTLLLVKAPAGYEAQLGELPAGVVVTTSGRSPADVIQAFVNSRAQLADLLPGLREALKPKGILWIAYPKGTAKIKTDLNRDIINAYVQTIGLQGVAMFAIDDTWSSMRIRVA